MNQIDYFKIFGFLAFIGSAFLSTIFHYPVFTIFWFVAMILFMATLETENSKLVVLALVGFAYIPLGLIYLISDSVSHTVSYSNNGLSEFAWLLVAFTFIEFILAIIWIDARR